MQAWTQWAVADQVPPDLYGELHPASVVLLVILALSVYRHARVDAVWRLLKIDAPRPDIRGE